MGVLSLGNFTGIYPRQSKNYLLDNAAQVARNVKLFSGEIRSWMKPVKEYTPIQEGVVSIFKMQGPGGLAQWCEWTTDTDVVRGPVADAEDFRIYYSENGVCKKTNWELCTDGAVTEPCPRQWLHMGVPAPQGKLTLEAERTMIDSEDGTEQIYDADNTENRVYVYTYVSTFGAVKEESAPSDPADVVCDIEGKPVKVSGFANPPTDHYNITAIRLYRVVTGSSTATYMLVDEFELVDHQFPASGTSLMDVMWSNSTYEDNINVADLGKELDTLNFTEPPEGLRGLVSMPNGFLAGFTYNQVWFSEPYLPYAWPADYMLTVDSQIVGLGVYGSTLVVCTEAQPYTISGTHPSAMAQEKQPMNQPCVSKSSIAYDQYGVLYASPHGIVALAGGQMDVFTRPLITRDEWQVYSPSLMVAAMYNNMYMASYHTGNVRGILVISRGDTPAMVDLDFAPTAMHIEHGTGTLYCLNAVDHAVYQMDANPINPMTYEWKSKQFQYNQRQTFTCAKVVGDYVDNGDIIAWREQRKEIMEQNKQIWEENAGTDKGLEGAVMARGMLGMCVNGSLLQAVPEEADLRNATITFFADDQEFYSKSLKNEVSFRIPDTTGYRWEVRVAGNINIKKIVMATSMDEMKAAV
jgi:hypothetical protein